MKSETFVCLYEDTLRFEIKVESRVTILYGTPERVRRRLLNALQTHGIRTNEKT